MERAFGVLQCMCLRKWTLSRFESVETMKKAIKCVTEMNKMVIEEHMFQKPAERKVFYEESRVCSGREAIQNDIVPMSNVTDAGYAVDTQAGRCASEMLKVRVDEHDLIKCLLIEQYGLPTAICEEYIYTQQVKYTISNYFSKDFSSTFTKSTSKAIEPSLCSKHIFSITDFCCIEKLIYQLRIQRSRSIG